MDTPDFCAVDFETYYDSDFSITELSSWFYCFDKKFDAYLVSVYHPDFQYCGHPSGFDWNKLTGKTLVMHNAGFDGLVMKRLWQDKLIPESCKPAGIFDSADMAAYLKVMRNLKDASKYLLNVAVSKDTRNKMKGKTYADAEKEGFLPELIAYAAADAKNCYDLAVRYHQQWPEDEQLISKLNRDANWRGVYIDTEYLDAGIRTVEKAKFEAEPLIPWAWDPLEETPVNYKKIREHCRACGIKAPSKFAKTDEEYMEWEEKYSPEHPWVAALKNWNRAHMYAGKLKKIRARTREDGTMPMSIKYCGTHTFRFSNDEGVNMLNLEKAPKFGVDIRKVFIPAPGHKFLLADLEQIEPRCLGFLTGDHEQMRLCRTQSPYEAHARATMGWTGGPLKAAAETDPVAKKIYATAKGRILALGYQAGFKKFIVMLRLYGIDPNELFDVPVSSEDRERFMQWLQRLERMSDIKELEKMSELDQRVQINAWLQVMDFRASNPLLTNLWQRMDVGLKTSLNHNEPYEVELPSGRVSSYYDLTTDEGAVKGRTERGGRYKFLYGGKLVENCLAGGTQVLTDSGWKSIEDVTLADKVHDGVDFVRHSGVVFKSVRPCVVVDGVEMTTDHEVLTDEGWKIALEEPRPYRPDIRALDCIASGGKRREEDEVGVSMPMRSPRCEGGRGCDEGAKARGNTELQVSDEGTNRPEKQDARDVPAPSLCCVAEHAGSVPTSDASCVEKLRRTGDNGVSAMAGEFPELLDRYGADICSRVDAGSNGQQRRIFTGELQVGIVPRKLSQHAVVAHSRVGAGCCSSEPREAVDPVLSDKGGGAAGVGSAADGQSGKPVYDILNCGPRSRFVVRGNEGPLVVHNCTQSFARDIFIAGWVRLHHAGFRVVWTVYDEYIIEIPDDENIKARVQEAKDLIRISPEWAKELPVDVSAKLAPCYEK